MAEGRRNSVDMPLSKTLVALKRVRSLRDPDTNSISTYALGINGVNSDVKDACAGLAGSDNYNVSKTENNGLREKLEDIGSNSDSDYASSKKSSNVRIRHRGQQKNNLAEKSRRHHTKNTLDSSWVLQSVHNLDREIDWYSESRINGTVRTKKSGYASCRKPSKAVEEAAMSRVGSPCISTSGVHTRSSSQSGFMFATDEVDIVDSGYSGCGISYCWSRTPRYREPTLSPDIEAEDHPLLSAERTETACREIIPFPDSPRSLSQKFRPKSFSDLVGLSTVAKSLLHAISKGKIAPVYLFHGLRGTGKTSTARIFAATLNCLSLEEHRPCGFCRECVFLFSGRSRDVKELDAAKVNRKDRVKALLKSASLAPFSSQFKVFIIDECQLFRGETWATIISSASYISRHSVFIMITTDLDKLPHTALSRCQKYHFPKIKDVDISFRLQKICAQEDLEFDKEAMDFIAAKCNGSLRDAETILDQLGLLGQRITMSLAYELIGLVSDDELLDLLDLALSSDTTNTVRKARDLMRTKVDPMQLVSQLANLIMDILSGRSQSEVSEVHHMFSERHAVAEAGMQKLRHALKVLSETEKQLRTSKNQATWLTVALLQFGTRDDSELSSPRNSLKNEVRYEDHSDKFCSGAPSGGAELEAIWRRALRKCLSSSVKRFLQKEGNLSSIHVSEGLAVVEIEFFHPDHVSRAEKSWKLIASSLQHVLGCDVQLRLKLLPTYSRKSSKLKKPSFSLLSCSGRKQQMSESSTTDDNESKASSKREIFSRTHSSNNGQQLSSCVQQLDSRRMQEVCFYHGKEAVIIGKVEEDAQSFNTASDRCMVLNIPNTYKSKSDCSKEVDEEGQCIDIPEDETQPNCFAKTLKLRRRFLSADAAQSLCIRIQPQNRQEFTLPKEVESEFHKTFEPNSNYSISNSEVAYNSGEENVPTRDPFSSKFLCWKPSRPSPRK